MRPKVFVLGTYHMKPTEDTVKMGEMELLPERKQKIRELIEKLKAFQPTKVAVEVVVKEQERLDQEYRKFTDGDWALPINEIYQVGFRLAKEMSHQKVHAIDWMDPLPGQRSVGEVLEWAEVHQSELHKLIMYEMMPEISVETEELPLLEIYLKLNDEKLVKRTQELYMNLALIGEKDNYIAMDWLRWWYQRNLIIYSNLARLVEHEKERIFLIVGADHLYTVNRFLKESNLFDVEYADGYL